MELKDEIAAVKLVGEKIGYGHMMALASALWRKNLKENGIPESGAFIPTIISFLNGEEKEMAEKESKQYDAIIKLNT